MFQPPRDELASWFGNAALVSVLWFFLPAAVRDWLFQLTGAMAFAVVLEVWMIADRATTNVLGNDVNAALRALDDPHRLRRWLRAKAVATGLVVGLPCALVALMVAVTERVYAKGAFLCVVLIVTPPAAATVGAWLGVGWPFRPRPLLWRWERRRDRRGTLRWLTLVLAPFLFVPAVMAVVIAIGVVIGDAVGGREANGHLDLTGFAVSAAAIAVLSLIAWTLAPYFSSTLRRRRGARLDEMLQDPDAG
jgi:hypothetical protein